MNNQEGYCTSCGEKLMDNTGFCTNCGTRIKTNDFEHNGNTTEIHTTGTGQSKKSGLGKIAGSIVSILIVVIASFVGKFAGRYMGNEFAENNQMNKIDSFVQSMQDYKPGVRTEDSYVSEFFNFQFDTNDNWFMYTEEELAPYSAQVKESAISSGTATLVEEGLSQDLIDKWTQAVYAETEMGAYYVEDDMIVGEATVGVFSAYGTEEIDLDEFVQGMLEGLSSMDSNAKSGEQTIAGETYKSIEAVITVDGMAMSSRIYLTTKENMICMINCKCLEGYELMYDSFFEQISQYDNI